MSALANIIAANSKAKGETFNVATGTSFNLIEVVDRINSILNTQIKPRFEPERVGDVKHSLADISKLKKLGYEPGYDFKTGLMKTAEYYSTLR